MTAAFTELSFAQRIAVHQRSECRRMRLLLRRRVLYLRNQWAEHKVTEPGIYVGDAQADRLLNDDALAAEWRFYDEDPKAREIGRELAVVERELQELSEAATQAGRWLPLDHLARLFSLGPFERDVVAMCLAVELDGAFEKLFAYVQDDVSRRVPTPALAIALFGDDQRDADRMRAFLPSAALRQFGLLRAAEASSAAALPLRLTERVTAYLQGVDAPDEEVAALLRPVAAAPLTARQVESAAQVSHWLMQSGSGGRWPRLNLYGAPEAGERAMARRICDANTLALHELDLLKLGNNGRELLRALERECLLSGWALYIDATPLTEIADAPLIRTIDSLLEKLRAVVFLGSRVPFRTDRPLVSVPVPEPDAVERAELWRQTLARVPNSVEGGVEALAEHYAFGPGTIVRIVAEAGEHARLAGGTDITESGLRDVCRRQAGQSMGSTAHRIEPKQSWADLVVNEDIRAQLQDIVAQARNRHQVYRAWEFGRKLSRGMGISVLFAGPSGTGKTMAAEVMARELGLDLYRIDLATVVSKYIGETEKNLRSVFDGAERSGAILFFDEADALFGKRTEVSDSHDRYANIEIDYLLQRMEDYNGLAVLATNMKGNMDQAFLRRLRFVVQFPFPDAALRERIWRGAFPQNAPLDELRYDVLARLEIPGGNIRNISLNAAFLAAAEGCAIGMDHVMSAARREYLKEEKLVSAGAFGEHCGRPR